MTERVYQKRQVAHKLRVQEIHDSQYVKQDGDWEPNYIELHGQKISRVNIIGVVVYVDEQENHKSISVEDNTGKIQVRSFDQQYNFNNAKAGDIVAVIGRIREFNNEKYIMAEIVKPVDKTWVGIRNIELANRPNITPQPVIPGNEQAVTENISQEAPQEQVIMQKTIEESPKETQQSSAEKLLALIKEQDQGDGAATEDIISKAGQNAEKIVTNLLMEGEIFEIKPGRLKVLE